MRHIARVGLILAIQLLSVKSQGYGNIEDDSAAPSANNQQQPSQQISSLPQYDPDPEGYAQAPASSPSKQQANPSPSADQSKSQDYWWLNQNAFQKPAGHPGVEPSDNSAAAPQQSVRPSQGNRTPNPYNAPVSPQNNFQQPKPQPQQYKPQTQPQSNRFQQQPSSPGSGWSGPGQNPNSPGASLENYNRPPPSNSLAQPGNDYDQYPPPTVVAPECQLLNKADCHKRQRPQQPQEPYNSPEPQQPPQNYRPPPQAQPRPQPIPQRSPLQQQPKQPVAQPPQEYYQPPPPQPYDSQQQNPPNNQNYQPQYSPESKPQASSFPQSASKPRPSPPQQPQQPYNRPAPQQQPYQNNGQYNPPQTQNQYYQSQPQQQQAIGQPVIGPIDDQAPYPGCPAAMLCVQDDQCNILGVIEDNLRLSYADKAHRVALSQCSEPSTGVVGICCRDPNYKDPWPDMNGGGNSGQYQPQHHDKQHGQSDNNFQQQLPQQQLPQSVGNPYSEYGDRKKKSPNATPSSHNSNNKPAPTSLEPDFHRCDRDEACVIHYKCANKNENVPKKKCKQDIFKNAYFCCKLPEPTTTPVSTPTNSTTTILTTYRPSIFTLATSRPLPQRNRTQFSPLIPTTGSIYKNNPFLTDTFPPDDFHLSSTQTTTTSTESSSLITGLGLRFHSHLHSKSALEANKLKPNPYIDSETGITHPAIVEEDDVLYTEIVTTPTVPTTTTITSTPIPDGSHDGNFSENSIIEPQAASSNHRISNQTSNFINSTIPINSTAVPENYTELYEPPANRTREILQTFWNVDNHINITETDVKEKNGSREVETVNLPPLRVPLREEFASHPPAGFIFKEYDLYIPDPIVPAGFFQPPKYQYGERQFPIPEDFPKNVTTSTTPTSEDGDVNATTILVEMENESDESIGVEANSDKSFV